MTRRIYFDHQATTPLDPEVKKAMDPFFGDHFGNPQSLHGFGEEPLRAITAARSQTGALIGAKPEEMYFTSSGAEANNLAIKGLAGAQLQKGKHIIVSAVEHFSVIYPVRTLQKTGFTVDYLPVDRFGVVDPAALEKTIRPDTILVSVMLANGEVGTIEPVADLAAIARAQGVLFHTDAVAAVGSIPVDVAALGVDALSLAGHQFYGPKGAAALYVRKGVRVNPQIEGGLQEDGRRGGTENVAAIVGLGAACERAAAGMATRREKIGPLRDRIIKELPERIDHVFLTGHPVERLPLHASFCVEFIEGEAMLLFLNDEGIAAASGSACTSKALKASHVLLAMGVDSALAQGSIVFSLGRDTTAPDVDLLLEKMVPIVGRLRRMSPLYAQFEKGNK